MFCLGRGAADVGAGEVAEGGEAERQRQRCPPQKHHQDPKIMPAKVEDLPKLESQQKAQNLMKATNKA